MGCVQHYSDLKRLLNSHHSLPIPTQISLFERPVQVKRPELLQSWRLEMDFDRTWLNVHFYVFCDYRIVLRMKIKSGKVLTRLSQCHCVCFFCCLSYYCFWIWDSTMSTDFFGVENGKALISAYPNTLYQLPDQSPIT